MKKLLQWIRAFPNRDILPTKFEREHYARFEKALSESPLQVYVYEERGYKGSLILGRVEDLHMVTPENLVSFRKLNRHERRGIANVYIDVNKK
jgi:hypothetical protein